MAYRSLPGMRFRTRPPGVVDGPVGSGTLDLPARLPARRRRWPTKTFKFTVTGPHMLAKTLLDRHYADTPELAHAIADVLAEQVRHLDADIVQIDEANLPGHPEEWEWAASAMNRVLDAVPTTPAVHLCFGNYGGQSVQKRHLGAADALPQRAPRRPRRPRVRAPAARGAGGVQGPEAGDRLRPRRRRHQGDRGRVGRRGGARDRARRDSCSAPAGSATSIPTAASGC